MFAGSDRMLGIKKAKSKWYFALLTFVFGLVCTPSANAYLPGLGPAPFWANYGMDIVRFRSGHVMARSVILTENGLPTYVEFDELGEEAREIAEASGAYLDANLMSGYRYRDILKNFNQVDEDFGDTIARGAYVLSRDAYRTMQFTTRDGKPLTNVPQLQESTLSVLVRHQDQLLIENISPILFEAPIDLTDPQDVREDINSLLISKEGHVLDQAEGTIGFKSGYFKGDEDGVGLYWSKFLKNDEVYNGIPNVTIEVPAGNIHGYGVTSEDGFYKAIFFLVPCPGFFFEYTVPVYAKMRYRQFNPRNARHNNFHMVLTTYDFCNGYTAFNSFDVNTRVNFLVDTAMLAGQGYLANPSSSTFHSEGAPIPIDSNTTYQFEEPELKKIAQKNYDFDGDDEPDRSVLGNIEEVQVPDGSGGYTTEERFVRDEEGSLQGVYLSSGSNSPDLPVTEDASQPDFVRLADREPDYNHQGLLQTISEEDYKDTDLYVFRKSNGMLITHRRGLRNQEFTVRSNDGVDTDEGKIFYQMLVRGPKTRNGSLPTSLSFSDFQSRADMNPKLHERNADHLRPEEPLSIIAINRKTGYIGQVETSFMDYSIPGLISIDIDDLVMRPPNLKVKAERQYTVDAGLTKGDENEYLIGYEGAATTSDTIITITTEWFDHDGSPLPEELGEYGYTGRLAKITGNKTVSTDGGQLAQFPIKPGHHLQTVRLKGDYASSEHFYVQINGEPENENPDFSTTGAAEEGPLMYRPKHYVPFLVPLLDEDSTIRQYNEYRKLKRDENVDNSTLYEQEPIYQWFYRPEMQFSLYDLEMENIYRIADEETNDAIDILPEESPTIANGDDIVELAYSMVEQQFQAMPFLGAGQQLVFAFGEEEIEATLDSNANIVFTNLEHFAALDPEDFLSIRLYSNNDSANVLWEYAFEYIYVEPATIGYNNQTDDTYYVTADDPTVDLKAGILGYAYRSEEAKTESRMFWNVVGDGSFAQGIQPSNEFGLFDNTLTLPAVKGAKGFVSVALRDGATSTSTADATWKTVEVLAGKPASIEIIKSADSVVALDQGEVRLDIYVRDGTAAKNLVEDGTDLSLSFADSLVVKEQNLSTEDGHAYVVFAGGEFSKAETTITVQADGITETTNLAIDPLSITFTPDKSVLAKQETIGITATVTKPDGSSAAGVPVSLSAGKGLFAEQELVTDINGQVRTTFTAGLNELDDKWVAQVGYVAITSQAYRVDSLTEQSINAQDTMLVADEASADVIDFDAYGVVTTAYYQTEATVSVNGKVGDTVTIGDMADPNLEPLLSLQMNQIDSGTVDSQFSDDHGLNPGQIEDIAIVYDHPLGAGRSAQFKSSSRLTIATNSQLDFKEDRGFRLDIKPQGSGNIVNYAGGALKLAYSANKFVLSVTTTSGTEIIEATAVPSMWHSVAAKVTGQELQLYVDGTVYNHTLVGSIINASGQISIGGLDAVMRGFRVYDFGSQPLITFADGSTEVILQAASETLGVKSLGNLGNAVANSQLKSMRVALIMDTQRNYAALLTKAGYEDIALKYLFTVSPQQPVAAVNLPLSSIIPAAHAWSWEGVWDGVKSTVGYLIPYEDFMVIGEQLVYLYNQDWENFDPTALAFASLGAATIIPIAKPLKPLLTPLKKVVDGMNRFPGAKHFAGAIGTAVKSGLSGKTEKLSDLLPFILIAIELYEDPEVFTFMMDAIESEDDLWVWVEVIADTVILEGGIDELVLHSQPAQQFEVAENPLSWLVASAHAQKLSPRQAIGQKIIARVKKFSSKFPANKAIKITRMWKTLKQFPNLRKIVLSSGTLSRYFAAIGGQKIPSFVRNSKNWRINRWFVLFSIAYLAEEYNEKRLKVGDEKKLLSLIAAAFSNSRNEYNGALFQLSQVAFYHAMNQLGNGPKVLGVEQERAAYYLVKGQRFGDPYKRRVDVIVESEDGGEEWIETKSLSKSTFSPSKFKNVLTNKQSYYRQFFHDLRLNNIFLTADSVNRDLITPVSLGMTPNSQYTWYFQNWTSSTYKGTAPTVTEEKKAQDWLCYKPNIPNIKRYYDENLAQNSSATKTACRMTSSQRIILRDTTSYFTDIVVRLNDEKNLGMEDFIDAVNSITDPDWM
ncbi:hypothetical protein [Microbulbifer sp. TRSA007]|uniref:hypothetical protein n=1 Tax=Microbulbifer sp. TRSA007 TaxID=3243384 RepID=UPI0040396509